MNAPVTPHLNPESLPTAEEFAARLEKARALHASLSSRTAALRGQAQAAEQQLKELEAEAVREYGTADLSALRELYRKWQRENSEALQAFEAQLAQLDEQVRAVEQTMRSPTLGG